MGFCAISITITLSNLCILNWFFVDHISGYWRYNVMPTRPT